VSLEDDFWTGLKEIAAQRLMNLSQLIGEIDTQRQNGNLSSAVRLFVLDFYRSRPNIEGRYKLQELLSRPLPMHY
jgi:predicted DNA-binding ribbon-helix-helix protein